jgi:hypothetical protein
MIKREPIQISFKRIECNFHGHPIKYKCEHPQCHNPYLCADIDCLEEHFHEEERLVLTKFNATEWEGKLQEVENVLNNDTLKIKEDYLTKVVDYFNDKLSKIKANMQQFTNITSKFSQR